VLYLCDIESAAVSAGDCDSAVLRRLSDTELPLCLCLTWANLTTQFLLQENDTGEILVTVCHLLCKQCQQLVKDLRVEGEF